MIRSMKVVLAVLVSVCIFPTIGFAAHPLVTDDTGTQGKGKFQIELNSEFAHENEYGVKSDAKEIAVAASYGIIDNVDVVLGVPYQFIRTRADGETANENGISDLSVEVKWRFFEKDGLSLALKPGVSLPSGDEENGLGSGKTAYSIFFIGTKEIGPWAFHTNLGYMRNENKADERENLWHASVATQVEVVKRLKVVANIGVERNTDRTVNTHPAFALGGLIYSITENLDIDFGVKAGLNRPETDYSLLAGLAWRF